MTSSQSAKARDNGVTPDARRQESDQAAACYENRLLRERIAALESENHDNYLAACAVRQRVTELVAALREYGWHEVDCTAFSGNRECTCGLAAALTPTKVSAQEALTAMGFNLNHPCRGAVLTKSLGSPFAPIKRRAFRHRLGDGHVFTRWGRLVGATKNPAGQWIFDEDSASAKSGDI